MRATLIHAREDIRVEDVPDARILTPTDAVVRVVLACICGSDLWAYREIGELPEPFRMGHEFLGVVEQVGAEVRRVRTGQTVVAPFVWADGTCDLCRLGLPTSCPNGGGWGAPGVDAGQGEAVRVPFADATLVPVPLGADDAALTAVLPLSDVLGTGHHACVSAGVAPGDTVAVVGDGAVGLCAVLAARRLGAERVIALSRNPARAALARRYGASEVVGERGPAAVERVRELTGGLGVDRALECVGTDLAWQTALGSVRDGGAVGYVGVPAGVTETLPVTALFGRNVTIGGGVAPVRTYLPDLLPDVLDGRLDASAVFDSTVDLDGVPGGYAAMDERRAIKVLIRP